VEAGKQHHLEVADQVADVFARGEVVALEVVDPAALDVGLEQAVDRRGEPRIGETVGVVGHPLPHGPRIGPDPWF
jgi:hypothetical protein